MDTTGTSSGTGRHGHPADLMDGRSAALRSVNIILGIADLRIVDARDGIEVDRWPLAGVRADALPDGSAVEVRHAERADALLTARGRDLADAMRSARIAVGGLPRGNRLRTLLIVNGISVVALVAGAVVGLPHIAAAIAHRVPLSVEQEIGGQVDALFDRDYCESARAREAMTTLHHRIEGPAAAKRDLRILDVSMPNAFTFPGGGIVVTRGLLREAESPDELAGVLAHEIQHVEQRHVMAQIVRGAILSVGWALTVGDFTGVMVVDPSTAFQIATLRFSRAAEESADRGAVAMLDRAEIPRDGLVRFFDRIKAKSDVVPEWLSSHPSSARRVHDLAVPAATAVASTLPPVLSPADWQALKDACESRPKEKSRSLGKILFGE